MAKNILVFADGTGNEGGLLPDESRTNVYKLYRATRTGPDSTIDPSKQLAFYVPGIGTPAPRHDTRWDRTKEAVRQMFGLGLTQKIIDCYVVIIGTWQPGDRIYLFGFSRGAYTSRCVSHVLEVCGIPTKERDGTSLNLDPKSLRKVAAAAVTRLSFNASRRLQLCAGETGVTSLIIRRWHNVGEQNFAGEPSAAATRWRVSPHPSPNDGFDGLLRQHWHVELLRVRGGARHSWIVEACDAEGHLAVPAEVGHRQDTADPAKRAVAG